MTVKQEKFVMARLKDYEERLSRLEKVLSVSVMVNDLGVDGSPSVEGEPSTPDTITEHRSELAWPKDRCHLLGS